MRRSATIAAASIATLAASSAAASAAPAGKEQVYYTITLQEGRLAGPAQGYLARNDGRVQQLQVVSFDWGAGGARVNKVDSFTVKQKVKPVGTSDLTMKRGTSAGSGGLPGKQTPPTVTLKRGTSKAPDIGKDLQAQDKMGNAPASTGIGKAIGNMVAEGNEDQALDRPTFGEKFMGQLDKFGSVDGAVPGEGPAPPPNGSLRVKVRLPWLACEEGKFYPQLVMGSPVKTTYILSDATVTGCSNEAVTFSYSKVEFERVKPH